MLKPDVLAPGGRQLFKKTLINDEPGTVRLELVQSQGPPLDGGQLIARTLLDGRRILIGSQRPRDGHAE